MGVHWFDYILNPELLVQQLDEGTISNEDQHFLMKELLINLLNSQNQGFFSDTPYELWFCETKEKKVPVMRGLCLQLAASMDWKLGTLEKLLPPPLLLYVLQCYIQMQPVLPGMDLSKVGTHTQFNIAELKDPGPCLHSLIMFHRWVLRSYMQCRTPQRIDRASNVMVPGVKRDPALIYRDQTNNFVMAMYPTSVRFLQQVLSSGIGPTTVPSTRTFKSLMQRFIATEWINLKPCGTESVLSLIAYDLGSLFFFNEEYGESTECFTLYFKYSANLTDFPYSDINQEKLNGYLLCLGLSAPSQNKPNNILFIESVQKLDESPEAADQILKSLDADTLNFDISEVELDSAELEIIRRYDTSSQYGTRNGRPEERPSTGDKSHLVTGLQIYSLVRRILKGLPLTGRNIEQLQNLGALGLMILQQQILKIQCHGTSRDKRLIRNLIQRLIFFNVLPVNHTLVESFKDQVSLSCLEVDPISLKTNPSLSETFNLKKICKYNAAVQLLATFQVPMLSGLAANIGSSASQISQRWHMEDHYSGKIINRSMNIKNMDEIIIMLSKVNQLKKMSRWEEATNILTQLLSSLTNSKDKGIQNLTNILPSEKLCIDILKDNEKLEAGDFVGHQEYSQEIQAQAQTTLAKGDNDINLLQELCLNVVLHSGDWESISHSKLPKGPLALMTRNMNALMLNIKSNNALLMKKFARDVWESVLPFMTPSGNKRKDIGQNDQIKERNQMQRFLERVSNLELALLVLSLLSSLYNVAKDDPSTELVSVYATLWPTGLSANTALQVGLIESFLQPILHSYIRKFPKDSHIILTFADLNFANCNYRSALALYVEAVAIKTDFFDHPIEQGILPDAYVNRMIRCCSEMGRLTQAVVLSQFCLEPNYAQVFKYLEDRETADAADALFSCIWDMSILEFSMSLHTRRGEVARRRHVLSCIMQLELNTNNEIEIKRAAANIRKSIFFRSLAAQLFPIPT